MNARHGPLSENSIVTPAPFPRLDCAKRREYAHMTEEKYMGDRSEKNLVLNLRSSVEFFKGSGVWEKVEMPRTIPVREATVLICDMWNKHWCKGATERVGELALRMAPVVDQARENGIQIIHAPSDLMSVYEGTEYRKRMQEAPYVKIPPPIDLPDPPLPLDASQGGCDEDDKFYWAWTQQHPAIKITGNDGITEDGQEVYNFMQQKGIKYLIIMGVHLNMCMLARSFAIRQMTRWRVPVILVRDQTDPNYSPKMPPYVDHETAIELMVEYIEKYWCPTIHSADLLKTFPG